MYLYNFILIDLHVSLMSKNTNAFLFWFCMIAWLACIDLHVFDLVFAWFVMISLYELLLHDLLFFELSNIKIQSERNP